MVVIATKTVVGWEEWVGLPQLGLPLIKAKVDTGAKTSAIHAENIKVFSKQGKKYVSFHINPIQKSTKIRVKCTAELVDRRYVTDSGGHREKRYVIRTPIIIGRKVYDIELTLSDRQTMVFRMLLGRQAMSKARLMVDPIKSCCLGKRSKEEVIRQYRAYYQL